MQHERTWQLLRLRGFFCGKILVSEMLPIVTDPGGLTLTTTDLVSLR